MSEWMSPAVDQIAPALHAAQQALVPAMKEFRNPAFPKSKYADLNSVLEAINAAYHPNGLFLTQLPMPLYGGHGELVGMAIRTVVMHTSGQWIASDLPMAPDMANPQKVGSCVTYGRRYGAVAVAGLMQEDDDGETAVGRGNGHEYDRNPAPNGDKDKVYPPPTKGTALYAWAKKQGDQFEVDLVKWLDTWGRRKNLPAKFAEWSEAEIREGHAAAVDKLNKHLLEVAGRSEAAE